ncbi:hypothetical protein BMG523Draft_04406 [Frankia sp. BMG5.23]|nr:hypothetical protein BMG523Draft_04406 [Frankia sp. BMG5.23]
MAYFFAYRVTRLLSGFFCFIPAFFCGFLGPVPGFL